MPSSTQNSALYNYYFYSFVFILFVLDRGYRCMRWDIYGGLLKCIKGWWWNWIWFLIVGFWDSLEPSEHHRWVFLWVQPHVYANEQKKIRKILDEGDTISDSTNRKYWDRFKMDEIHCSDSQILDLYTWSIPGHFFRNMISTMHIGSKLWLQECSPWGATSCSGRMMIAIIQVQNKELIGLIESLQVLLVTIHSCSMQNAMTNCISPKSKL
jgi:hypothetical protein